MLLRAIIVLQKRTFRSVLPKFSSDKMTLCNNNDQTWFFDTLTSARPLRSHLNSRLSGLGFNITQQMLSIENMSLLFNKKTPKPVRITIYISVRETSSLGP